jgi:hypothetical protein
MPRRWLPTAGADIASAASNAAGRDVRSKLFGVGRLEGMPYGLGGHRALETVARITVSGGLSILRSAMRLGPPSRHEHRTLCCNEIQCHPEGRGIFRTSEPLGVMLSGHFEH